MYSTFLLCVSFRHAYYPTHIESVSERLTYNCGYHNLLELQKYTSKYDRMKDTFHKTLEGNTSIHIPITPPLLPL